MAKKKLIDNAPLSEDNLYPNDGAPFMPTEPAEQVADRAAEKGKLLEALPLVHEIIDRLKERIALYDSVLAIPKDVRMDVEKFMHTVSANELTKHNLIAELEWLEGLLEDYLETR